jgi:hypothetical protein
MKKFFRDRYWFGWWWASICSKHMLSNYDPTCGCCGAGGWTRVNHNQLFGKQKWKIDSIDHGFIKYKAD